MLEFGFSVTCVILVCFGVLLSGLRTNADTSYVSKSSVKKLSDEELQYAVNEVYARHGLKFTKKKNKERFEKKEWYVGTVDDQNDISLNKYEKKNVDTMAAELKKRGLR